MAAIIRSLRNGGTPVSGASRDDLRAADLITCNAVGTSTTYAWTMVYRPQGSVAAFSGDVTQQSPGSFTVDLEGPYLVRLTVNLGLPTESTQFVRLRFLTVLGDLKLIAAGEQNDGAVPVPVDATTDGWANEQNFNILALLNLVQPGATSGRVLYVDANVGTEGYGNYNVVQDAIDAAETAGASVAAPWMVLVRPATYTENLTFKPFIHVTGWPSAYADEGVVRLEGRHTAALPGASDLLLLSGLTLVSTTSVGTTATVTKTGLGTLQGNRCQIRQDGTAAGIGPAFDNQAGLSSFNECSILAASGAFLDRFAAVVSGGRIYTTTTNFVGTSGLRVDAGGRADLNDSRVVSTGAAGSVGLLSDSVDVALSYSSIEVAGGTPVQVNPTAAVLPSIGLSLKWVQVQGDIYFDTTNVAGASTLNLGSCEYNALQFPGGSPSSFVATTKARSLFYDNTVSGLAADNVQDAIDEVAALALNVQTLDDAYDGGVGGGLGRTIVADSGAVQIVDAGAPVDPPSPSNPNGRLQVTGGVEVGSIGYPEILLDPNPYGNGPMALMGTRVWADNAPHGSTAFIMAASTGDPQYRNYNLRLQTQSAIGGGQVGWLIARGGDGLPIGVTGVHGGPVVLQGGSGLHALGGDGGSVYILPGGSAAGTPGLIVLADPAAGVGATLTAAGAFVGGVTGTIRFATDMGGIAVDIDAADNLAAVLGKLTATGQITAIDSGGGVIQLTTVSLGPTAEVYYLNDTVGNLLDTALGAFDGQAPVSGTWPNSANIQVTAPNEITFGVGGATGPMIYNADTGKLTVPGVLDPTALILTDVGPFTWTSAKGTLWTSDGTGGTTLGDLYYIHEFGASASAPINLAGQAAIAGTILAEEEGTPLGRFDTVDFVGPGVTASSMGGGKLQVLVTGGGGGTIEVRDEGVSIGTFSIINFVGANVQAFGMSGVANVYIPPPIFDSHWNTADGSNGDQSVTESISRTSAHIPAPSGGEGFPFKTGGWAGANQPATLGTSVTNTTPSTTTGFGGDSTMTVVVYDADGVSVLDSYTTAAITGDAVHTSPSTRIVVTITSYGVDAFRFKAHASVAVNMAGVFSDNSLDGGRYHVAVTHTPDSTTDGTGPYTYTQSDVFLDTNPTTPSISGLVTVGETSGSVLTKHLSGIEYYILGSQFTAAVAGIDQLNRNTSRTTLNLTLTGTEYGLATLNHSPFGTGAANFTGWTNFQNVDGVSYQITNWSITTASYRYVGPSANISSFPRDPWASGGTVPSTNTALLIDTYLTTSTNLIENFDDEARRQDSGYNSGTTPGNWVSTATLLAGEALVFGGQMMVPNTSTYLDGSGTPNADWSSYAPTIGGANPNYSGLGAPVSHYRTIVDVPGTDNRASFTIVFTGTFVADAYTDLAAGNLEIYIRRRASSNGGNTGPAAPPLLLHGALYNNGTFDDGVTDGHIRESAAPGNIVPATFGGYTCETGFFIEVKIINPAIKIDRYEVTFF